MPSQGIDKGTVLLRESPNVLRVIPRRMLQPATSNKLNNRCVVLGLPARTVAQGYVWGDDSWIGPGASRTCSCEAWKPFIPSVAVSFWELPTFQSAS